MQQSVILHSDMNNFYASVKCLDECWLDVTESTVLFGDGKKIADEIRSRVKQELGITASIGISYNKIFAKLGSDMRKLDATTVIGQPHPVTCLLIRISK